VRLYLFLFLLYSLFYSGRFYASDEVIIGRLSQSIVEHFSLRFPPTYGRTDSPYGLLNSIIGIPPYLFWRLFGNSSGGFPSWNVFAFANLLLTPFVSLIILHYLLKIFSLPLKTSFWLSLVFGSSSLFFPYAKTFFTEPLCTILVLLTVYYAILCWRTEEKRHYFLTGLFFALTAHTRLFALLYLLPVVFYLPLRRKRIFYFFLPVSVALLLVGIFNFLMRGSPLRSGYETSIFSGHILSGLYGLLVSPGRGLLLYNPWSVVSFVALPWFLRKWKREGGLFLAIFLTALLSHSAFWTWHGGWTIGTRFLMPVTPLIFFFIIPLFIGDSEEMQVFKSVAILLFAVGFLLQISLSLVNLLDYNNELYGLVDREENRLLYIPQTSGLAGLTHLLRDFRIDQYLFTFPKVRLPLFGLFVSQLLVLIFLVRGIFRHFPLRVSRLEFSRIKPMLLIFVFMLASYIVVILLSGTRGLELRVDNSKRVFMDRWIRWELPPEKSPKEFHWRGYLETPSEGRFVFYLKVLGTYDVRLGDEEHFFHNERHIPQHLPRREKELSFGYHPIEIRYCPYPGEGTVFYLYWTVPGEARYIEPVSPQYLWSHLPSARERFFTKIRRHLWLLYLPIFLSFLFLHIQRRGKIGED